MGAGARRANPLAARLRGGAAAAVLHVCVCVIYIYIVRMRVSLMRRLYSLSPLFSSVPVSPSYREMHTVQEKEAHQELQPQRRQ